MAPDVIDSGDLAAQSSAGQIGRHVNSGKPEAEPRLAFKRFRAGARNEGSLSGPRLSSRLFCNCRGGSTPQRTLFLGVRGRQTALHLVIRGGITIAFVRELFREQSEGEDKAGPRLLSVPPCCRSHYTGLGQPRCPEPRPGPQLANWPAPLASRQTLLISSSLSLFYLLFHWPVCSECQAPTTWTRSGNNR